MAFEIYKPRGERSDKSPIVTLSKNSLVMNNKAREYLNNPAAVELSYDKDSGAIRIKPADSGLNVKKTKVFAKGFYNYFNIDAKGRYVADFNETEQALYVRIEQSNQQ